MASRQQATGLKQLSTLIDKNPEKVLWDGSITSGLFKELCSLPIELPQGDSYLLYAKGRTLYLASTTEKGISKFRFATNMPTRASTEFVDEGISLADFGSSAFEKLVVLKQGVTVPKSAVCVTNIDAPLELLDRYADLHSTSKNRTLTEDERKQKHDLVKSIRKEFEKTETTERYPSYRSTPSTSGESSSSSYGASRAG